MDLASKGTRCGCWASSVWCTGLCAWCAGRLLAPRGAASVTRSRPRASPTPAPRGCLTVSVRRDHSALRGRARGRAAQGRPLQERRVDPQLMVGLLVDRAGFPWRSAAGRATRPRPRRWPRSSVSSRSGTASRAYVVRRRRLRPQDPGVAMRGMQSAQLVLDALGQAVWARQRTGAAQESVLAHSDRGLQDISIRSAERLRRRASRPRSGPTATASTKRWTRRSTAWPTGSTTTAPRSTTAPSPGRTLAGC